MHHEDHLNDYGLKIRTLARASKSLNPNRELSLPFNMISTKLFYNIIFQKIFDDDRVLCETCAIDDNLNQDNT